MPVPKSKLESLKSEHGRMVDDQLYKTRVYEVDTPHILIQAIGYLKYLAGTRGCAVGYRGQRKLYDPLIVPTLFRGVKTQKVKTQREKEINTLLNDIRNANVALKAVQEKAWEPLLQHYGVNTRWIDLVDNVWVALWFACHRAHAVPKAPQFVHYEKRVPQKREDHSFAYIVVLEMERGTESSACRGLFEGTESSWVDLRVAAPSHFVRPHAQHGILFRKKAYANHLDVDCGAFVAGIIRTRLCDAVDWLGEGQTLSAHAFFPPPLYDFGYRQLLGELSIPKGTLGTIQHVGA